MWEAVELRELRVFVALADELHFGRTAERLHLSQSRVSQSLRKLERQLGALLVERTSRRVALTEDGRALLEELRPSLDRLDGVLSGVQRRRQGVSGTLNVGVVSPPTGGSHFSEIVKVFQDRHPGCRVVVHDVAMTSALAPLRAGEIDVVALRLPVDQDDLVIGPILSDERRALAVARGHRLADRTVVELEDLADERVARLPGLPRETEEAILPARTPSGAVIERHRHVPATIVELIGMVARGELVHLTSDSLLRYVGHPDVVEVPVAEMPRTQTALAWVASGADGRRDAFVAVAAEVLATRGGPQRISSEPTFSPQASA